MPDSVHARTATAASTHRSPAAGYISITVHQPLLRLR
jgi:hypothetical protein